LGLTTALQLARAGFKDVRVVANHMPGDNHPEYTSIWAGVNWVPVSKEGSEHAQWDIEAWTELLRLATDVPGAGVFLQDKTTYCRNKERTPDQLKHWYKDLVFDYKILSKAEVPLFADWGIFYRSLALDPSIYLHYLQSQCLSLGVKFRRAAVSHIREAFDITGESKAHVVVNCTGLWASKLGGVNDANMVPIRGQLVIVENDSGGMFSVSGDDTMQEDIGECCYVIPRPAGGGTALGGSYFESWSYEADMALAGRIMQRAVKVCPHLVPEGAGVEALRVVRHQVGLRPVRIGGPRVEREALQDGDVTEEGLQIVHCYGSGGFGFQSSYGMANKAVRLVREALRST